MDSFQGSTSIKIEEQNMADFTEAITQWLKLRWRGYDVERIASGGCGLVFILHTSSPNISPQRFALKTFNPAEVGKDKRVDVPKIFERELRIWLKMPYHPNVLSALGLEFADIPLDNERWPIVRMPFCDETLGQWLSRPDITISDRMIALIQFCNGLRWLYQHGVDGHGDLKPDNVLLRNLHHDFTLEEKAFPWCARVSDLGWADIWKDLGSKFFQRSHPGYQAPERFDDDFVAVASDMFAVGVMICEVLSCLHPAGKAELWNKWKRPDWRQWAKQGERQASHLPSRELAEVTLRCLDPAPKSRPTIDNVIATLVQILERDHRISLTNYLELISINATETNVAGHRAWAFLESASLSHDSESKSMAELESTWQPSPIPESEQDIADWLFNGQAFNKLLLKRANPGDADRVTANTCAMLDYVVANYGRVDLRWAVYRTKSTGMRPFEVMEGFGLTLLSQLERAIGSSTAEVEAYHKRLNQLGRFYWELHLPEWLADALPPPKQHS